MKSSARWMLLALCGTFPGNVLATGGWVPERFLDEGGQVLKGPPQFYWDLELNRLAKQYAEKDLPPKFKTDPSEEAAEDGKAGATAVADNSDFEEALKSGKLKPTDLTSARAAQVEMRAWLQKGGSDEERPKLAETDSEFADYHRGAALLADDKPAEAKVAWEKLLQRPAEQRHYRTVWAAFMLGKACMQDEKTRADAVAWFGKCRQYAREGFADSLNLAADSYGWQARAEYDAGDRPASARHYLQQLALGDTSAIRSLKLLVPDRETGGGLSPLSFESLVPEGPQDDSVPRPEKTEEQLKAEAGGVEQKMIAAAKDEVLRQIVTAHVLATGTSYWSESDKTRLTAWLEIVEKAKLDRMEGAASLGWAAYTAGKFAEAEKWAKLDKPASPLGQWLQAKLALRKGDFAAASSLMVAVVSQLPDDAATRYEDGYLPKASAAADLGASLLAQGKFKESLAAFWSGGCWFDAGYVAERLLATDELLAFVKANAMLTDEERAKEPGDGRTPADMHREMKNNLMNLAGRRLIREDRNAEGRLLLGEEPRKLFDQFRELGAKGNNEKNPKKERAKALFDAACLLEDGSSWCGTEDDVVRAEWGGYAPDEPEEIVHARLTGKAKVQGDDSAEISISDGNSKVAPLFIVSTPAERKRLQSPSGQQHMKQYVRQAAALAVKAAALLPDNTEETADVLNQAGRWIQDLDNPGADKIYFQIEKRCAKTEIGKAVIEKHWFIEPDGPWTGGADASGDPPVEKDKQ